MTKAKELRDQTEEQLEIMIEDLQKEIFELRNEFAMSRKLDKPHMIREKRKDIARALTILKERKNKEKGA